MKAITNSGDKSLEDILKEKLSSAKEVIFCVSFIKNSGVELLFNYLKHALKNNAKVSILTSTYLNVTEPIALYKLKSLKNDNLSLSIFDQDKLKTSFHIKGYYFKFIEDREQMIIGSSNISKTALTSGLEWNILFEDNNIITEFLDQYNNIIENYSFNPSDEWLHKYFIEYRPNLNVSENSYPETKSQNPYLDPITDEVQVLTSDYTSKSSYQPIKCQIPALYELDRTRGEGFDKALIIMATGLGKTFLSAFDSKDFKRILFIAHREEILEQAQETFKKIRPQASFGYFKANQKDTDKDIIFGSISTLGKEIHLNPNVFLPDYFDYIIVDEFHHSAARTYLNFLDYFRPKFLLGLTATPDRLDNKDIYQHCDYNIAFECNFKTAINNGWLVPFSYYAIYDDIDYESIPWRSGKYDIDALEKVYMVNKRSKNIIKNYKEKAGKHTIAFCCSIRHADYTAKQFQNQNIKAQALHSGTSTRSETISKFSSGEISLLCVVDIFNEGIDIPHIDTVMFLRPTESFTIFIQQLGRGLRTNTNKVYLTVLDFVGNYKNSHLKLSYLAGLTPRDLQEKTSLTVEKAINQLPIGCSLDLDLELVDIFESLRNQTLSRSQKLIANYNNLKDNLDNKYSLSEFNSASDIPANFYISTFGSWLNFLMEIYSENQTLQAIHNSALSDFLSEIEKTAMTKLYKMPTILSLIQNDTLQAQTTLENITHNFKYFYQSSVNAKDLNDKNNRNYQTWSDKDWANLAERNPIHFLSQNPNSIFTYDQGKKIFSLKLNDHDLKILKKFNEELTYFVKDRIEYRREGYVERKRYRG
ncbi:DEAD/DEAH box helicase family protein [bacterium]|nr:DEAD/DEAH box helicase family protein [bacterium]